MRKIIDTAHGLEGLRWQDSIHAAAVVISPTSHTRSSLSNASDDAEVVTQFEMRAIERSRSAQDGLPRAAQPDDDRALS